MQLRPQLLPAETFEHLLARAGEPTTVAVPFPVTITASDLTSRGR